MSHFSRVFDVMAEPRPKPSLPIRLERWHSALPACLATVQSFGSMRNAPWTYGMLRSPSENALCRSSHSTRRNYPKQLVSNADIAFKK